MADERPEVATLETPRREDEKFRIPPTRRCCSYKNCRRDAILQMNRSSAFAPRWYSYCERHSYGRVVRNGEVWWDPAAAKEAARHVR